MREMFDVGGRTFCETCADAFCREHGDTAEASIRQHVDPTICANCGFDGGEQPHGQLMRSPMCAKCIDFFRNRPFPKWVVLSFAGVLLFVVVSFVCNLRFLQAHFEVNAAMASQDLKESVALSAAAAEHVPEVAELREIAAFYEGISCLYDDRCEEALACFARCTSMPEGWHVADLKNEAMQGAAFDRKDYDQFLKCAEEAAARHPNTVRAIASVASALACKYAAGGDENLRKKAEAKLEEVKKFDDKALKESNYEERIRYRLQTREIIDRKEFQRRFPNGWKSPGEKKT
jgi:hypothetical protein